MYVVTKCLSPDNVNDQKLAESFVRVTHQKQCEKEKKKEEKARFASFLQVIVAPLVLFYYLMPALLCMLSSARKPFLLLFIQLKSINCLLEFFFVSKVVCSKISYRWF